MSGCSSSPDRLASGFPDLGTFDIVHKSKRKKKIKPQDPLQRNFSLDELGLCQDTATEPRHEPRVTGRDDEFLFSTSSLPFYF